MAAAVLVVVAGCASSSTAGPSTSTTIASTSTTAPLETGSVELGPADRPAQLVAPGDVTAPAPLLVLLHGYGSKAQQQDAYLGVTEQAASRGLYVLLPEGTTAPRTGRQFWDATSACCNFTGTPVDDVGYVRDLIDEAVATRPIDPARIYLFGHSNGGFMAYRLACDLAGQVTAVAVLAGADAPASDDCLPSQPVSVLHLHGSADELVKYEGGRFADVYPGAVESVTRWAARDGCEPTPVSTSPLDLEGGIDGAETVVSAYTGCEAGTDVQLDTIEGAGHIPRLIHDSVGRFVLDWLLAHAR
jgi:polyhydroxybutyrate depolymerase